MPLPPASPTGTAVVTGASSGIGAHLARELVARGRGVTLVAPREDRLRELATELGDTARVEIIACDLADPDARANLFDAIEQRGLTVDVLVNNAGIGTAGPVADSTVDAEVAQVRVNVEAVIELTTRAIHRMVPRGCGGILNVGSTGAFAPVPGQAGYAATKAFVRHYTDGVRMRRRSPPRSTRQTTVTTSLSSTKCSPGATHNNERATRGVQRDGRGRPKFTAQARTPSGDAGYRPHRCRAEQLVCIRLYRGRLGSGRRWLGQQGTVALPRLTETPVALTGAYCLATESRTEHD
ncbi:SDR family NAD(P)-dependent oxidoreductase [Mycolicibacterium baixiangningiae]|uniref:SDR family NAD(P)-dependent oxidoreductase n=1 Tax=Mycolicibacterium baixiangningiae TaxID=2761578 RepID=UPI0018D098D1|nr:SDR family NAD(P)-dependent oxidoreductase [Mycolicibacterium baixiangningiae]